MNNRNILGCWCLCFFLTATAQIRSAELPNAGPLIDHFPLTLDIGSRTELLGPLFYWQERDSEETFAIPPLFSHVADPDTDSKELDFAYPILTYDRFGKEFRWQLVQLISISGGQNQSEIPKSRFTIFPIYFQQRSPDPDQNYTALFPIYGHLEGRLFRSEIDFALWPVYVKSVRRPSVTSLPDDPFLALRYRFLSARRGDVTTYNYVYPLFHLRYGDGLKGWQLWPLAGHEHKEVTQKTNSWGDVDTIAGHDKRFWLWPIFYNQTTDIGTDNPEHQQALLPFYSFMRSPQRDSTSYLWPVGVTITDDRRRKYKEVDAPWPFIVFAHGEGKTTSRIWPLFSHAHTDTVQKDFYLWPVYKYTHLRADALDRRRTRILFYLCSYVNEKNIQTQASRRRLDFWPLFTSRHDFNGSTRFQLLAPLESILPNNKSIERDYSPLWSIWRAEKNPTARATSQSLLWNLYRRETNGNDRKCSLLFGIFQYQSVAGSKRLRLLYVPVIKTKGHPENNSKDSVGPN